MNMRAAVYLFLEILFVHAATGRPAAREERRPLPRPGILARGQETTPRTEGKTLATIKLPDTPEHRKLFALLKDRRDTAEHVFRLRALNVSRGGYKFDSSFGRIGGVQPDMSRERKRTGIRQ